MPGIVNSTSSIAAAWLLNPVKIQLCHLEVHLEENSYELNPHAIAKAIWGAVALALVILFLMCL